MKLQTKNTDSNDPASTLQIAPWRSGPAPESYQMILSEVIDPTTESIDNSKLIDEDEKKSNDDDGYQDNHEMTAIKNEGTHLSTADADCDLEAHPTTHCDLEQPQSLSFSEDTFILGHYETLRVSMIIAPLWFFANYFYNLSLRYTSITSSTIISSSGSLFTFLFAVLANDEVFTPWKCIGVGSCIIGNILTGLSDRNTADDDSGGGSDISLNVWGDILGLLSAIGYGVYTVFIRVKCPKNEHHISMQLLFGYIGLMNMVGLSPFILYQYISYKRSVSNDDDAAPWLGWTVFGLLVLKGLFDNVLSDYLWARSIVLTSATVATVGVGLTIPLAFLSDWWINNIQPTLGSVFGALSVTVGFIIVNIETQKHSSEIQS